MAPENNENPAAKKTASSKRQQQRENVLQAMQAFDLSRQEKVVQLAKDYKEDHEDVKNRDKHQDYSPWLVIRYSQYDVGFRPLPAGTHFWTSPDIWVESSDPMGNPVFGQNNYVHARIFNLGMAPAFPVKVDFYWADPSMGLDAPHMTLIGSEWVNIPSLQSREIRCQTPWVPQAGSNTHQCLMVNCTAPYQDGIREPFHPTLDRHVGQRNCHVVTSAAWADAAFRIHVNNILPMMQDIEIRATCLMIRHADPANLDLPQWINQSLDAGFGPAPNIDAILARYRTGSAARQAVARRRTMFKRLESQRRQQNPCHQPPPPQVEPLAITLKSHLTTSKKNTTTACTTASTASLLEAQKEFTRTAVKLPGNLIIRANFTAHEQKILTINLDQVPELAAHEVALIQFEATAKAIPIGGYTLVLVSNQHDKGRSMITTHANQLEYLRYIIQQVDEAADILSLVEQLAPALPIRNLEQLVHFVEKTGGIRFRDQKVSLHQDTPLPAYIFPIEDIKGLIDRVTQMVAVLPAHYGVDFQKPERISKAFQRQSLRPNAFFPGMPLVMPAESSTPQMVNTFPSVKKDS